MQGLSVAFLSTPAAPRSFGLGGTLAVVGPPLAEQSKPAQRFDKESVAGDTVRAEFFLQTEEKNSLQTDCFHFQGVQRFSLRLDGPTVFLIISCCEHGSQAYPAVGQKLRSAPRRT